MSERALSEQKIDFAALGDNVVIPAIANEQLLLVQIFFVVTDAVDIKWVDGVSGDDLTGVIPLAAGAPFILDASKHPWFTTTEGRALVLNLSVATQVSGRAYYRHQQP